MPDMRQAELEELMKKITTYDVAYQKILLKEFFIKKVLYYIYKKSPYQHLTFTWGTCLRVLYDLPRLSEDIDLDISSTREDWEWNGFEIEQFATDVQAYMHKHLQLDITTSIKSRWQTCVLKLPILKMLGLSTWPRESDLLYIKCDIQPWGDEYARSQITPYMKDGLYMMIRHYDLPTLFSYKLRALFGRWDKVFHDKYAYKWRDFFDMIWYLQQGVVPNFSIIRTYLRDHKGVDIQTWADLADAIYEKISTFESSGIYDDIQWLIEDPEFSRSFADHYLQIYEGVRGVLDRSE